MSAVPLIREQDPEEFGDREARPLGFMTELKGAGGAAPGSTRAIVSYLPKGETFLQPSSFSLKYLVDGEEIYTSEGRSHKVRSGQILLVPSGQSLGVELRRPSAGLCLYFDLPEAGRRSIPTLRLNAAEFLLGRKIAHLAASAMTSDHDDQGHVARFLVEAKPDIDQMLDALHTAGERVGGLRSETRRQRIEKITSGRMFLESNAHRPVGLEEAAAAAGMSLFHFSRQFAQTFGESPGAYHQRLRLDAALTLLAAGRPPSAVARELGYSEPSVFGRAFSRRFGVPPTHWASAA